MNMAFSRSRLDKTGRRMFIQAIKVAGIPAALRTRRKNTYPLLKA
jgi:hypothetical protein